MTARQPVRRHAAAGRRAARRAAAALRAIHAEQVLMRELSWQPSRIPVDRAGPLTWTPGLDGPRLTGGHLPVPDDASVGNTMTGTLRQGLPAAGTGDAQPLRWLELE